MFFHFEFWPMVVYISLSFSEICDEVTFSRTKEGREVKASLSVHLGFVVIVVAMAFGLWWALAKRTGKDELSVHSKRWFWGVLLGLCGWFLLTGGIASTGVLQRFDVLPPPFGLLLIGSILLTTWFAFSFVGKRLLCRVPLYVLVGAQCFRIFVELSLHELYKEGLLPIQMTYSGMNFDILSGLSALVIAWLLWKKKMPSWGLFLWNVVCLGLLVTIVSVAVLSTPFPFRVFMNEPANTIVTYLPFIWLPTFLVQMALLGHLLVFRVLFSSPTEVGSQ